MKIQRRKLIYPKGFTLVEIVVAIGLVALLLSGVLGLMGVSAVKIDRSIAKKEAKAAAAAVEQEIGSWDKNKDTGAAMSYDTYNPFTDLNCIATWAAESNRADKAILYYRYAGDPSAAAKPDGSMAPFDLRDGGVEGINYVLRSEVRRTDEGTSNFQDDFDDWAIVGNVYLAKFRNYTRNNGDLELSANYGETPDISGGFASFQLEIYKLPLAGNGRYAALQTYLNNNIDKYEDALGRIRPVFKTNVSFRLND